MATYTQANDLTSIQYQTGDIINIDYTGNTKDILLQPGRYRFECWGAKGGGTNGGNGAYTKGSLTFVNSQFLYTYVGQQGAVSATASWNGGGAGSTNGGAGGGASDIRLVSGTWSTLNSLRSRIMVAAGGGGSASPAGGAGGAISGIAGTNGSNTTISPTTYNGNTATLPSTFYTGDIINYDYSGSVKTITLPAGTYQMECWGAQGGDAVNATYTGGNGGKGGYVKGQLVLASTTVFYIIAGQQGLSYGSTVKHGGNGGFGAGGAGANSWQSGNTSGGAGGGGLSGIFTSNTYIRNGIMIASAGGGGAGSASSSGSGHAQGTDGGDGGGLTGGDSKYTLSRGVSVSHKTSSAAGKGGTQTSGGTTDGGSSATAGGHLYGGRGGGADVGTNGNASNMQGGTGPTVSNTSSSAGGGGGAGAGYYGGGGSGNYGMGGAGGSSFISGHSGCNAMNSSGTHTGTANHFSGLVFTGTSMSSGTQSGNGYVRITVISGVSLTGNNYAGNGATQTAGGTAGTGYSNNGNAGSFGTGAGRGNTTYGTGAGGGYYGGGSAGSGNTAATTGGSGSGSSFISGYSGCNAITSVSSSTHTGQPNHYSGFIFTITQMTAGNASMPNPRGTGNITGNAGNGFIRITVEYRATMIELDYTTIKVGNEIDFNHDGTVRSILLPAGVYRMECWGAQCGVRGTDTWNNFGGYTSGILRIIKNTNFIIYVGGQGQGYIAGAGNSAYKLGGWNGGGGNYALTTTTADNSTGGGASDICYVDSNKDIDWSIQLDLYNRSIRTKESYQSRIMVAGGAGGGRTVNAAAAGGSISGNIAGTQTLAGIYGGTENLPYVLGDFGYGASTGFTGNDDPAGGGGYYGGGIQRDSYGGGGSSFISGLLGCDAINNLGIHTGQPNHFSELIFSDGVMIPNVRSGDGFIKITCIGLGTTIEIDTDVRCIIKADDNFYTYQEDENIWKKINTKQEITSHGIVDYYGVIIDSPYVIPEQLKQLGDNIKIFVFSENSYTNLEEKYRLTITNNNINLSFLTNIKKLITNDFGNLYRVFSFNQGLNWYSIIGDQLVEVNFDRNNLQELQDKGLTSKKLKNINESVVKDIFKNNKNVMILTLTVVGEQIENSLIPPDDAITIPELVDTASINFYKNTQIYNLKV